MVWSPIHSAQIHGASAACQARPARQGWGVEGDAHAPHSAGGQRWVPNFRARLTVYWQVCTSWGGGCLRFLRVTKTRRSVLGEGQRSWPFWAEGVRGRGGCEKDEIAEVNHKKPLGHREEFGLYL